MITSPSSVPGPSSGGTSAMLPAERARASFNVAELTKIVAGKKPAMIERFSPLFSQAPFDDQHLDAFAGYAELFKKKIERVTEAFRIVRANPSFMMAHMAQKIKMEDLFEHNGIFLHFTMMLQYIKSQGTKEQQDFWLEKARQGNFIAAYAQTELGHGSNVRGLETTATYDPSTQEFEIHSPTLTSLKWWPTGMYACTHALVFAQLHIGGKDHGMHGFMVQLRQADGTVMPGVELGEIGPKLNDTSNNIGYCRFTRVRVPLRFFFSKFSKVTPEGQYIAAPKKLSKFRYISMMVARVAIVAISYDVLAQAATIAVRYSAVRRQGFQDSSAGASSSTEHVVLDYQMQQYRVFKALSLAYCLLWNKRYILVREQRNEEKRNHEPHMAGYIKRVRTAIEAGDESAADGLPELHATLSGMKAVSTVSAHYSIEECRRCCGGQGFLKSSGIAKLSPDFSEWVTVEGEQVILSLQCARFLIKACNDLSDAGSGGTGRALAETVQYLAAAPLSTVDVCSTEGIISLLQDRAKRAAWRAATRFGAASARGSSFDEALNSIAVVAYKAAECHVAYVMALNNHKALAQYFGDRPPTHRVLADLLQLHGLMLIRENAGDWLGLLTDDNMEALETRLTELLARIRPEAVSLVDAFGFLDSQLKSTLGRADGNVYEAIYDAAKENPLNASGKMVGWETYAKVLDLEFLHETSQMQRAISAPAKL